MRWFVSLSRGVVRCLPLYCATVHFVINTRDQTYSMPLETSPRRLKVMPSFLSGEI